MVRSLTPSTLTLRLVGFHYLSLLSPLDQSTIRHADTGTGYYNPAFLFPLLLTSLTFLLCLLWITSCLGNTLKVNSTCQWSERVLLYLLKKWKANYFSRYRILGNKQYFPSSAEEKFEYIEIGDRGIFPCESLLLVDRVRSTYGAFDSRACYFRVHDPS